MWFNPYLSEVGTEAESLEGLLNRARSFSRKAGTIAFEMAERPQHLLGQKRQWFVVSGK